MHSLTLLIGFAALGAGHGIVDNIIIDGTTYPSFDPRVDLDFPNVKRINWGYQKTNAEGTGPVGNVKSHDITCRQGPLIAPAINAVARAGSLIEFQWTEWFGNHKGPILTYMGRLPSESTKVQDVEFFKIDESTYNPKTETWGTDQLIANNNTRSMRVPSDIKPGMYVIRHELISLHFSFREDKVKQTSGAQHYPMCIKVQVIGDGVATPPGKKFPGAYNWNDPGILINIYYGPNQYISPGPPIYNGPRNPPQGYPPTIKETGDMVGEQGQKYARYKTEHGERLLKSVHDDVKVGKIGGGGCHWEVGQPESTMKCVPTNPDNPAYVGFAQPKGSPLYTDKPGNAMNNTATPPKSFEHPIPMSFRA